MNREELLKNAKPILFSTEMVQAILDNRKTVTRRVIKFPEGTTGRLPESGATDYIYYPGGIKRPLYIVGDILYVRETWQDGSFLEDDKGEIVNYIYKADDDKGESSYSAWGIKWKPSIHMPKEAARIFLKVNNVKVEKLQDMTQEDCIKEGCGELSEEQFAEFWNSLNAKRGYGWKVNPWVWVVEFERVEDK